MSHFFTEIIYSFVIKIQKQFFFFLFFVQDGELNESQNGNRNFFVFLFPWIFSLLESWTLPILKWLERSLKITEDSKKILIFTKSNEHSFKNRWIFFCPAKLFTPQIIILNQNMCNNNKLPIVLQLNSSYYSWAKKSFLHFFDAKIFKYCPLGSCTGDEKCPFSIRIYQVYPLICWYKPRGIFGKTQVNFSLFLRFSTIV